MQRYLESALKQDLGKKILILSGPRQVGKTTLSKTLAVDYEYLNFDRLEDRKKILKEQWDRSKPLLILDELHKMKKWKQWLKGIYDTDQNHSIIVTGSAKLDTYKKVGDSLAGRYFQFRLLPLDLKELRVFSKGNPDEQLENLLNLSGFPEPYLSGSESFYKRWRQTHLDIILKQDLVALESVRRITDIETLVELMRERAASPLSYNSLKEDLQTDDKTIKRWMLLLENSYVFFKVLPYSKSLKLAIKKSPKYYFFDTPRVIDAGARFENLVALTLYKEVLFRNDTLGEEYSLHYLRDKLHKEIDFLICKEKKPIAMIETKLSDENPSNHFEHFSKQSGLQSVHKIQVVLNLRKPFSTKNGIQVVKARDWLPHLTGAF